MIYLDNAATTKIHPDVLDAMMPYLQEEYGNAGTLYKFGRKAHDAIENARKQVADLIKAKPEQIVFTSGGSEANSMVFNGVKEYLEKIGKKHIVVSKIEHDSVLKAAKNLIKDGFHITLFPVKSNGEIDLRHFEDFILKNKNEIGLVSIMHVNNEIGSMNQVSVIGEICQENNVLFHTDCVQSLGSERINVNEFMCDFLSMSSHKIHGPKGVGALYIKNVGENFESLIHGGGTQEFGIRGGTENVPGIVGFGRACKLINENISDNRIYIATIKTAFLNTLYESFGDDKDIIEINGKPISPFSKSLNLRFKDVDGETLLLMLGSKDICVSAGSACRSHESLPSHVLLGIGLDADDARDSIRVSFSKFNTYDEVIEAAVKLANCVSTLRGC